MTFTWAAPPKLCMLRAGDCLGANIALSIPAFQNFTAGSDLNTLQVGASKETVGERVRTVGGGRGRQVGEGGRSPPPTTHPPTHHPTGFHAASTIIPLPCTCAPPPPPPPPGARSPGSFCPTARPMSMAP